jgi:hypothetical protein
LNNVVLLLLLVLLRKQVQEDGQCNALQWHLVQRMFRHLGKQAIFLLMAVVKPKERFSIIDSLRGSSLLPIEISDTPSNGTNPP